VLLVAGGIAAERLRFFSIAAKRPHLGLMVSGLGCFFVADLP